MIETLVQELKDKIQGLKELVENDLDPKTKDSKLNSIRRVKDEVKKLTEKTKDAFFNESQVYLVQTPHDFEECKSKLAKYGFMTKLTSLAHDVSERSVAAVIYRNGQKDGYSLSSIISLLSQEIRKLLVDVGVSGYSVPKLLSIRGSTTPRTREQLTLATYKIIKDSSKEEQKPFEDNNFIYATKDLTNWLMEQESFTAKNKILILITNEIDNKLVHYLQEKTGKAVNVIEEDSIFVTLDTIKKSIKVTA